MTKPIDLTVNGVRRRLPDRKSTRLNSSHPSSSYAVSCLKKKKVEFMGAAADVVHLLALDVHAADEHDFRPFEIRFGFGRQVLVDEANLPMRGQIGREHQQSLRRHESFLAVGQGVGMLERAERRRIFFFNASATTEIYTLSLHDALPI